MSRRGTFQRAYVDQETLATRTAIYQLTKLEYA